MKEIEGFADELEYLNQQIKQKSDHLIITE